jgi:beta-galactosidase/beta-glucuronidase
MLILMHRLTVFLLLTGALAAAQGIPRPEYPQPQFERELWQNLNGPWEFEFDDKDEGLAANWGSGTKKFSRTIVVPYAFETKLSGIGDTSFHPVVWYRRSFSIPDAWRGKRVLLHFGAVDYEARVWVNGQGAGGHIGGHTPFRLDITPYVRPGANTLVVRAWDPPEDRSIPRGKQYWEPKSRGIFYTRTSGIWQPVWLEAAGDSYLEKVRVDAGMDGTATFDARIARPKSGSELHITVSDRGKPVASAMVKITGIRAVAAVHVQNPRLWSVATPNLYDVTYEIRDGAVLDRVKSYFGFRTIGLEKGRVTINHRPVYLKWLLDQGYWPESNITPPTDEAIQFDIAKSKEMGFNGCRKHQKLEDPRFLYWADKMGFLVSSEMANAYLFDETYVERFTAEWIQAVERDYNHPSIIMWIPINESWGVPNLRDPRQQNHLRSLYTLTKSLDSQRFVIDNDGWEHTEMTDLFGIHDYSRTGSLLLKRYGDPAIFKPGSAFPRNAREATVPGVAYNGSPVFLSEFGGIAYIPPGHQVPKEAWGYSGVEKTQEDALKRMRGLWEAIAEIKPIMGICYTQTTDVEQEINGLMTYDRKLKFDPKLLREMNDLLQ